MPDQSAQTSLAGAQAQCDMNLVLTRNEDNTQRVEVGRRHTVTNAIRRLSKPILDFKMTPDTPTTPTDGQTTPTSPTSPSDGLEKNKKFSLSSSGTPETKAAKKAEKRARKKEPKQAKKLSNQSSSSKKEKITKFLRRPSTPSTPDLTPVTLLPTDPQLADYDLPTPAIATPHSSNAMQTTEQAATNQPVGADLEIREYQFWRLRDDAMGRSILLLNEDKRIIKRHLKAREKFRDVAAKRMAGWGPQISLEDTCQADWINSHYDKHFLCHPTSWTPHYFRGVLHMNQIIPDEETAEFEWRLDMYHRRAAMEAELVASQAPENPENPENPKDTVESNEYTV
ncbi:hypothetical protein ACLMJK_005032 [Lecanora helva]